MYFELSVTNYFFFGIPNKVRLSGTNPRIFLVLEMQAIANFAIPLDC